MPTFYLVRHGSRVDRMEDTLLSKKGIKQAQLTAKYLSQKQIKTIIASPLPRCQQTAEIIATTLAIPVVTDDRLKERMLFDESKWPSFAEFLKEWDKTMANRSYIPPGGDSAERAGQRLAEVLNEVTNQDATLIVSHGGIIGDFLRNTFGDQSFRFKTDLASSLQWLAIDECAVTGVKRENDIYLLQQLNTQPNH